MANRPITPPWHTGADKDGPGQRDHRPDKRPFNEVAHKTGQNRAPHLRIPSRRCPHISSCLAATAGTAGETETQRKRARVREKGEKNDCALTRLSPPPTRGPFQTFSRTKASVAILCHSGHPPPPHIPYTCTLLPGEEESSAGPYAAEAAHLVV